MAWRLIDPVGMTSATRVPLEGFRTKKSCEERTVGHLQAVVEWNINGEERSCYSLSTVKDALLWTALLLVFSNHLPASLLSPELCLVVVRFADTVDGGFALSLAGALGELNVVGWGSNLRFGGRSVGGLWRRETDLCAGGRRG